MIWLAVVLVTIAAVVAFLFSGFEAVLANYRDVSRKALRVVRSKRISDCWKERVLPVYAARLLKATLGLAWCLALLLAPVAIAAVLLSLVSVDLVGTMTSWTGLAVSLGVGMLTVYVARPLMAQSGYRPHEILLHYIVLGTPGLGETLFGIEHRAGGVASGATPNARNVFVAGLARAGTTVLMRSLYGSGRYRSLTYADMPFVLAPRFWRRLRGQVEAGEQRERPHADGVFVDQQSPEALDEAFWLTFCKSEYVGPSTLRTHAPNDEIVEKFRAYVANIVAGNDGCAYLSKNNNAVLRVPTLIEAFPDATVLLPFRDPLAHAQSMRRQHKRFKELQRDQPFVRSYMGWLGHHEFGLDLKRMEVPGGTLDEVDDDRIDFWLEQWLNVYGYVELLVERHPDRLKLISYERLCSETETYWPRLCGLLGIGGCPLPELTASSSPDEPKEERYRLAAARELYHRLDRRFAEQFLKPGTGRTVTA